MKIQDVMTRHPESVSSDTNLIECAQKMKTLDVGSLPVVEESRPIGIITDRDIVIRGVAEGRNPRDIKAQDCMSRDVAACFADDDVKQAAKLMQQKQIRRLLVIERNSQQLTGVVSLGDLAILAEPKEISQRTLERVSEPAETQRRKVA